MRPSLPFGVDEELLQKYADAPHVSIADALGMKKGSRVSLTGTVLDVNAFENILVIGLDNGLSPLRCQLLLKQMTTYCQSHPEKQISHEWNLKFESN